MFNYDISKKNMEWYFNHMEKDVKVLENFDFTVESSKSSDGYKTKYALEVTHSTNEHVTILFFPATNGYTLEIKTGEGRKFDTTKEKELEEVLKKVVDEKEYYTKSEISLLVLTALRHLFNNCTNAECETHSSIALFLGNKLTSLPYVSKTHFQIADKEETRSSLYFNSKLTTDRGTEVSELGYVTVTDTKGIIVIEIMYGGGILKLGNKEQLTELEDQYFKVELKDIKEWELPILGELIFVQMMHQYKEAIKLLNIDIITYRKFEIIGLILKDMKTITSSGYKDIQDFTVDKVSRTITRDLWLKEELLIETNKDEVSFVGVINKTKVFRNLGVAHFSKTQLKCDLSDIKSVVKAFLI